MHSNVQHLFSQLMEPGRYIMRRNSQRGVRYCLYEGNMVPVLMLSDSTFKNIKDLLKEKKGRMTLNLKTVRSLHGNSFFKKTYKKSKAKCNT